MCRVDTKGTTVERDVCTCGWVYAVYDEHGRVNRNKVRRGSVTVRIEGVFGVGKPVSWSLESSSWCREGERRAER